MEGVARELINQTLEIETSSMRLKLREGGRENSNQEIQEKNERNEEIEGEEDRAFEAFLSHVIEGEVAEHPGVEDL